eukprot:TRINITY_DN59020_c0_g3_i1.p1 TRINITY_DN59020_c0_g3~~TRINITY_DN59020_c0_g3_i1.p1  ORF type:complete len:291 (-),score=36.85 TRINITY_DN59020_c0_g3_i1:10-822(-)
MACAFPLRAVLEVGQEDLARELRRRGIEVVTRDFEDFLRSPDVSTADLVVGNHLWTRAALAHLDLPVPEPPDYPVCLQHLLHRRIWQSTLGEMAEYVKTAQSQTFIKPAQDAKTFSAVIEPQDQMLEVFLNGVPGTTMRPHPPETPVHCAEVVNMVSEYRVYVVEGTIRAVCHYGGGPQDVRIDMEVVEQAVQLLAGASEEGSATVAGCGIDFAVMRKQQAGSDGEDLVTCLVEVNDGYSLGIYEGIDIADVADLLIARWRRLLQGGRLS